MEMQKLVFFRDAPAPWQGPPPGGPDSLTAVTSIWYSALHNGIGIIQKDITACPHKLVWVSCFFLRTGLTSMRGKYANHKCLIFSNAAEQDDIVNSPNYEDIAVVELQLCISLQWQNAILTLSQVK